jgi:hypothetical protein
MYFLTIVFEVATIGQLFHIQRDDIKGQHSAICSSIIATDAWRKLHEPTWMLSQEASSEGTNQVEISLLILSFFQS